MKNTSLWQQIQKGDKKAFNQLFKSYYSDLKAYGIKVSRNEMLAKEAIQMLFVKIWNKRATLNDVTSVKSYLIRAYRRTLVDLIAAEKKIASREIPQVSFLISPEEFLIFEQDRKADAQLLSELLNQLPDNQKEIIYLRFYNHLSYLEIAEIMDLKYQTVRNYGVKALQFLSKKR